ncbi:MAG: acyl--CoA ligase family protein [Myxococcota bacterium]
MSSRLLPAFGPEMLSPLSFLDRAAVVYGDRTAVVDGSFTLTYEGLNRRCRQLAGALHDTGLKPGDRVSVLSPNTHALLETHFGVPAAGGVLNALNTRLSLDELAYIIGHAESRVLVCDRDLLPTGMAVAERVPHDVLLIESGHAESDYERRIAAASAYHSPLDDEWSLLSLNYTSGTTGRPKGVMYAHRGAYLQAFAMVAQSGLDSKTVFLWTLPMFHCNGWCFPWAVTAVGGTHLALRTVRPDAIWAAIRDHGVTHFNAAPTVLTMLASHPDAAPAPRRVRIATGGAPPSPTLLARLSDLNLDVTHLYGLTETYGPAVICDWRPEWDTLDDGEQARLKARQGVSNLAGLPLRVVDDQGRDVPADGETTGEVLLRGNNVMLGYYRDPDATREATVEGPGGAWFRTGDIGVLHSNHYLELRDRKKDVIISGGENIASIEVEQALDSHPDVVESAVVGAPDPLWGEILVAFVTLKPACTTSAEDLIAHVRSRLARFKAPKRIEFGELPKTSTGKVQKFVLRRRVQDPSRR